MKGRRYLFLALLSGILLGIPWCLPELFFLIFVAWVPLLFLEKDLQDHPNPYVLFNYSLLGFLVWNLMGSWWIAQAQWFGAILILLLNSLVMALVFWTISRIRTILKISILLPFLLIWLGYEHFHQWWDLAWPWFNLGNSLATAPRLIQWYEYTGVRGGSLWILLINLAAFQTYVSIKNREYRLSAAKALGTLLLFVVPFHFSNTILSNFRDEGKEVEVALIQPNLDPYTEKFIPKKQEAHFQEFFRMADSICDEKTQILLGPETLIVQQVDEDNPQASPYYRQILQFQEKHPNLSCLLGIHTYKKLKEDNISPDSRFNEEENFYYEAFNTAVLQIPGETPQFYHKTKLVPLFERVPFVDYLRFLGKWSMELGGYSGTYSNRQASDIFFLQDSSEAILPVVCFESVFGPYCAQRLNETPGFICMITNDGWWKHTPGYRHHFHFSVMRAIETRRDLVRVANTGISAFIDAKGTILAETPWWKKTTLKGPVKLRSEQTFFALNGDFLGRLSLFFGALLILYGAIRFRINRNDKKEM